MASIEDDLAAGGGAIVSVLVLAIIVIFVLAWRKIQLSPALYPYSIWGNIATGTDAVLNGAKLGGGQIQNAIDRGLGSVSFWLLQNTPNPAKSPNWAAYADATYTGDGETQISTGG